jgi:hypothetical protein
MIHIVIQKFPFDNSICSSFYLLSIYRLDIDFLSIDIDYLSIYLGYALAAGSKKSCLTNLLGAQLISIANLPDFVLLIVICIIISLVSQVLFYDK